MLCSVEIARKISAELRCYSATICIRVSRGLPEVFSVSIFADRDSHCFRKPISVDITDEGQPRYYADSSKCLRCPLE